MLDNYDATGGEGECQTASTAVGVGVVGGMTVGLLLGIVTTVLVMVSIKRKKAVEAITGIP